MLTQRQITVDSAKRDASGAGFMLRALDLTPSPGEGLGFVCESIAIYIANVPIGLN